jgi:methionine-rich copper-binding protein CopC
MFVNKEMMVFKGIGLMLASLCSAAALAHAAVQQSIPAQGAHLSTPPREVNIIFNEKVEKLFTTAVLTDAAGTAVATDKSQLDAANPALLRLALPVLKPGAYIVAWTAVGRDGHRRKGHINFSVN